MPSEWHLRTYIRAGSTYALVIITYVLVRTDFSLHASFLWNQTIQDWPSVSGRHHAIYRSRTASIVTVHHFVVRGGRWWKVVVALLRIPIYQTSCAVWYMRPSRNISSRYGFRPIFLFRFIFHSVTISTSCFETPSDPLFRQRIAVRINQCNIVWFLYFQQLGVMGHTYETSAWR